MTSAAKQLPHLPPTSTLGTLPQQSSLAELLLAVGSPGSGTMLFLSFRDWMLLWMNCNNRLSWLEQTKIRTDIARAEGSTAKAHGGEGKKETFFLGLTLLSYPRLFGLRVGWAHIQLTPIVPFLS